MTLEQVYGPDGEGDGDTDTDINAYVSPLADFVLLLTVTLVVTVAAVALIVP